MKSWLMSLLQETLTKWKEGRPAWVHVRKYNLTAGRPASAQGSDKQVAECPFRKVPKFQLPGDPTWVSQQTICQHRFHCQYLHQMLQEVNSQLPQQKAISASWWHVYQWNREI